jgi:hypothetical protein
MVSSSFEISSWCSAGAIAGSFNAQMTGWLTRINTRTKQHLGALRPIGSAPTILAG